ncbi:tetratricopeptide repeat protein [Tranquillimonas alkanivorans]|uniref:TPR repeat-containing protein n=1 Tax=Tranquillimonas alkanivorans TaxID=441119 RepID=A0A1I5M941_9RHOB|nr:tetratricopeptide repeat protein [Tranquillimonas alkanivorans]SFP06013.1 TPR repeat-containing protein [Tranquillimonas alkanivorans]
MMRRPVALLPLLALLAACTAPGGEVSGPFAPASVPASEQAVDGLVVGHRLMAAGEHELALKSFLRATAEHGATAEILSSIGSANLRLGRLNQAEGLLREAVETDPDYPAAWNNLGVVLMERGKVPEAAQAFHRAFALDSGRSVEIRDNLALALAKKGNPSYAPAQNNFALVRRGTGDFLIRTDP